MSAWRVRYERYIGGIRWKRRRDLYFATHPKACAACGREDNIQLHHRTYVRFEREEDEDLMPLCAAHHAVVHQMHQIHGGTIESVTDQAITILQRRLSTPSPADPRGVFVPKNQRPNWGKHRKDWRGESRGLLPPEKRT